MTKVPASDLPDNLVPESDLPTTAPEVGGLESFGRGAAQAFALGYSPQVISAIKTGKMPGSSDPEYVAELAKQKAATEQAWEQHPYLYGTGMVTSAIPAAVGSVLAAPEEAAGAGLLAGSSSLAGLGGAGLRAIAGEGAGAIPSALRGIAGIAENPVVQGAIYGSSSGEDVYDKLSGAAAGAIGAKIAPYIVSAAGKGIGALGSSVAPKLSDQISQMLNKGVSKGQIAGAIGDDVGFSVPAFVGSESGPSSFATNFDMRNAMAKASNRTVSEIGGILNNATEGASPDATGEAIRNAIGNWVNDSKSPSGFKSQLNAVFKPIDSLKMSPKSFDLPNLQSATDAIRNSSKSVVYDVEPTLRILAKAEASPNGLTFDEMHELRQAIADQITFNRKPGSANLDEKILNQLYGAITDDMKNAANQIGGIKAVQNFNAANKQASDLYKLRDSVIRMTGNPDVSGPNAKTAGNIYQSIENAALKKASGPNLSDLRNLQNVLGSYEPATWDQVGQTYVAKNIAPNGYFSFGNMGKKYGYDLHPVGKDMLFSGGTEQGKNLAQTLNKIEAFGNIPSGDAVIGNHIDNLSKMAGASIGERKGILGELGLGAGEMALMGGLPLKTIGTAGAAGVAGALGARNIAAPLSQYAPTTGQKIVGSAIQKAAPSLAAQAINPFGSEAIKNVAIPYAVSKGLEYVPQSIWNPPEHKSGGRTGHATGGRTASSAKGKAAQLINLVDRVKKEQGKQTEPLLNLDDTTVAKALAIANQHI
jgi:hypothetical protein